MDCETAQKLVRAYDSAISYYEVLVDGVDIETFETLTGALQNKIYELIGVCPAAYEQSLSTMLFYMRMIAENPSVRVPAEVLGDVSIARSIAFRAVTSSISPIVVGGKQPPDKSEHWEVRAVYMIARNPDITKKEVADEVGVHPATIGRSKVCREAFRLAIAEAPTAVQYVA